jgi:hypothetical protein
LGFYFSGHVNIRFELVLIVLYDSNNEQDLFREREDFTMFNLDYLEFKIKNVLLLVFVGPGSPMQLQ